MATSRTQLLEQMNDMFIEVAKADVSTFPSLLVTVAMRNALMDYNHGFTFTKEEADQIVSRMKIELPMDLFEDEDDKRLIFEIIDSMVEMIAGLYVVIMREIESFDLFLNMIDGANLEIKDR